MAALLLIADSHVRPENDSRIEFMQMLDRISRTPHDVCFLGDILELWFGLSRYDNGVTTAFLDWCRREKSRRSVYLVEGNHEFFVAQRHHGCFTKCGRNVLPLGNGLVVAHGDIVAPWYSGHRIFRLLTKNWLTRLALMFVPGAPAMANCLKRMMEKRTLHRVFVFPSGQVHRFATRTLARHGADTLLMGHFHQCRHEFLPSGKCWFTIPDWKKTRKIGLADADGRNLRIIPWRRLSAGGTGKEMKK